jgi:hypothetical protein
VRSTLCLLSWNEIRGCQQDVPRLVDEETSKPLLATASRFFAVLAAIAHRHGLLPVARGQELTEYRWIRLLWKIGQNSRTGRDFTGRNAVTERQEARRLQLRHGHQRDLKGAGGLAAGRVGGRANHVGCGPRRERAP